LGRTLRPQNIFYKGEQNRQIDLEIKE
jgi:hypothetical protein